VEEGSGRRYRRKESGMRRRGGEGRGGEEKEE